jgi:hypothetical protein
MNDDQPRQLTLTDELDELNDSRTWDQWFRDLPLDPAAPATVELPRRGGEASEAFEERRKAA